MGSPSNPFPTYGVAPPQGISQPYGAASTYTSSVPGGGTSAYGAYGSYGSGQGNYAANYQSGTAPDYSGGNQYLTGLNYSVPSPTEASITGAVAPTAELRTAGTDTISQIPSPAPPPPPPPIAGPPPTGAQVPAPTPSVVPAATPPATPPPATPTYAPVVTGPGGQPMYQPPNVPGTQLHVMGGSNGQYFQDQYSGRVYDYKGTLVYDPGLGPGGVGPTNPTGTYPYSGTTGYGSNLPGLHPASANPPQEPQPSGPGGGAGSPIQQPPPQYPIGGGGGGAGGFIFPGGGQGNFPSYGGPGYTPNPQGAFPNTYGGPFTSTAPAFNATVPSTMFSGNEGPQQGAVGRPPSGYGLVPPYSPAMSQTYFQWLMNQAGNLGQGVGATPYGQQQTYLPSQGQAGLTGLSAPMSPFAGWAQNALTSNIYNIGDLLNPQNLQAMMGQYTPLTQQASLQSQYGARGNPNDPYGLYTGAQALQGAASGVGLPGLPGQYLNSAMQYGGMGLPAQTQALFAQYGAGPGAGGTTLSNMAQFGNPIDQTPAWQAMVQAQQRNIGQNAAQVARKAAVGGNLLGSPYQTALADFYNQAGLNQNALLGQMTAQAQEQAAQRMLGAAGTMSGQQLGAAQNLGALQQQAGLFGAGNQLANAQYLQNLMASGLGQQGQFTALGQQIPNQVYQNYLQQMGGQIGNALNLGQAYQGLDQNAINRQYQEFLRTQPEYSPLLQQLFAGATTFPGMANTKFGAGMLPSLIGQGLGYLGQYMGAGGAGGGG